MRGSPISSVFDPTFMEFHGGCGHLIPGGPPITRIDKPHRSDSSGVHNENPTLCQKNILCLSLMVIFD